MSNGYIFNVHALFLVVSMSTFSLSEIAEM